jgi:ubiquinone biosynthesis protein
MAVPLRPRLLRRYRDIGLLLVRYGRSDLFRYANADDALAEPDARTSGREAAEADGLARHLEELGPTFIKLGQLLSTRPDLLPAPYLDALSRLQDRVEPFPFEQVKETVESELGVRISRAFSEFDPEPTAAASLAQVHRAALRDGRPVAVKVQRPGLRRRVADDLEALESIAEFADAHSDQARRLQVRLLFDELKRSLLQELDFHSEARNLETIGTNLEDFERIVVPRAVVDFTTSRVITMDWINGRKITDVGPMARLELDGAGLAAELFRAYLKQILVDGVFHADPHPGNVLITDDDRIGLVDLGMVARLTPRTQENLLQLLMAIAEGRSDDAARIGLLIGTRADGFEEDTYRRGVADLVGGTENSTVRQLRSAGSSSRPPAWQPARASVCRWS